VHYFAFDGNYGIRERRNSKTSECRPHERRRRKETLDLILIGCANRIPNENRPTDGDSSIEK
jgi:hypothetical protein